MFIYPENMNAKATMWLWNLKDLAISGSLLLFGFFTAAELRFMPILVIGATYAFLTIRIGDSDSILDYIINAARFCFGQQQYDWSMGTVAERGTRKDDKKVYAPSH